MARARTLTPQQQDQILAAADPMMAAVAVISFHCGLRVATIARLDWSWLVDATGELSGIVEIPAKATKKQRAYAVGLTAKAKKLVEAWWIESGKPVAGAMAVAEYRSFHQRNGAMSADALRMKIKRLFKACEIEASSHSGRRSCAQRLLAEGADAFTVQAVLGHANFSSVVPYVADHTAKQAASQQRNW